MALTREKFYIIVPKAATNLCTNPSFEYGIMGWAAEGAGVSIARTSTQQRRGAYSCEVTTATGVNSGAYFAISLTSGTQYTFSVDIKDVSGQSFTIAAYNTVTFENTGLSTWIGTGAWVRKSSTFTAATSGTFYLFFIRDAVASTTKFYFDGAQLEVGGESTYFDGDSLGQTLQKDYGWNGTRHASTSYRLSTTRSGGTLVDIETYASVLSHVGLGRAPEQLFTSEISGDGELYQATKVMPRDFVINMVFSGTTSEVVSKRKSLLSALALDKTPVRQPIVLRYLGVDDSGNWMTEPVDIPCHYRGGLERSAVTYGAEISAVQFRAVNPYHNIDGGTGQPLGYATTVTNFANIGYRDRDGVWRAMGTGCNGAGAVRAIVEAPDGSIYVGGEFTLAGGVANTAYIAKWNGTAWSALSTGMNSYVYALTVDAAENLYAGGNFTLAGGVANTAYVAKWNGTAWSALSTGMNSRVNALSVDYSGQIYAGGGFTTAGGLPMPDRMAIWSGGAWKAVDINVNDSSAFVYAMMPLSDDRLYFGGSWTGSSATSATSAAHNNTGTKAYPTVVWTGPGIIWQIKNYTNGDVIYFKSLTLLTGETITLITDPRRFSINSSFRGNVQSYISPGSSGFALEPGSNNISAFMTVSDANSSVVMTWQPTVTSIEEALR